jgi:hypothetical protein
VNNLSFVQCLFQSAGLNLIISNARRCCGFLDVQNAPRVELMQPSYYLCMSDLRSAAAAADVDDNGRE